MSALALLLALIAGAAAGRWLARKRGAAPMATGVGPHLLPDPALEWLRRSHQALGVWVAELDPHEEGPRAERIVEAERLEVAQIVAVDRRLERARDQEQSGVERMEGGILVFHAAGGAAVGLLMPNVSDAAVLAVAEDDLRRLLDGVRRRPQIVELAQAQADESSPESASSVGLRLAYQLERALEAQIVVAACELPDTPVRDPRDQALRVRVIGVSGKGDRRLLDTVLPDGSPLAQVALGVLGEGSFSGDPLGAAVADRRQRPISVVLRQITSAGEAVGAVAIWPPGGRPPVGAAEAELTAALESAGPRLYRARKADQQRSRAMADRLTGLLNRRGLDEVMARQGGSKTGALIYADLDRFKSLNDTLGHPAGDAALVHFSDIIKGQIRAVDAAARIGGEEFAIWLPGAELDAGSRIAERIRIRLSTTSWAWQGKTWPLTASFGVAGCPETSQSLANLAAQADAALYVAKNSGRNRVERAGAS
ncbi:MAG TPA: GGDEF domain-containing protein [Gemmatimonadales bacterium]|jgi:diguanylate cyclase (GGDEF)-like protein